MYRDFKTAIVEHFKGELKQMIADDQFKGIEVNAMRWLRRTAPRENRERDELFAQVRYHSVEAAQIYDPFRGAKFSTFLVVHLRLRCQAFQQRLWSRSSGNQRCRMLPLEADDLLAVRGDAEASARTSECVAALSDESRDSFAAILAAMPDNESSIIDACHGKHFRKKLLDLSGVPRESSEKLFREVRSKLPDYL